MIELKSIYQLKYFNNYGLKSICGYNRDLISGFNSMKRSEIEDIFIDCILIKQSILIPNYIYENPKFLKKVIKK